MNEAPILFAFVAGTVASANPCGFALLPAFFASYAATPNTPTRDPTRRMVQGLVTGAAMTLAVAFVFIAVGTALSSGATVILKGIPWATIVIGGGFVVLGLAMLSGRHISIRLADPFGRSKGGYRSPLLFGLGYAVASLSCTLPVFLSVVGASLSGGGLLTRAGTFLAYATGMGTVLTTLTLGSIYARDGIHRVIRRVVPYVSRVSGVLLVLAGVYLVYYRVFFLLPGSERRQGGDAPIEALNRLSAWVQTWLAFGAGAWVALGLVGLLAVLAAVTAWRVARRRTRELHPVGEKEVLQETQVASSEQARVRPRRYQ